MSLEGPADNIRELSLEDPVLAARVVDLCCFEDARERGALVVLVCDAGGLMVHPLLVDEVPWSCERPVAAKTLKVFLNVAETLGGALVIALARPAALVTDTDRRWHQMIIEECRDAEVRLFGVYVATPNRVVRLPDPNLSAAAM